MQHSLRLARRGLGFTFPNPSVGCIIVKNNQIIAEGHTGKGGVPHAEVAALAMAGADAAGATAYVTLEPCCHYGKTMPCTEALIAAGIARVVVALQDPDARMQGKGFAQLNAAGIALTVGVCEAEAREVNAGFLSVIERNRPLVTLKLATSLDGKIATASGESQWITGETARRYAQLLRAEHDAIMVGVQTVISDNPALTCRLPGLEDRSPIRVVMDSHLRTPPGSTLVATAAAHPTWIITTVAAEMGDATVLTAPRDASGRIDINAAVSLLATRGITRLLVEGGGKLAASLLTAGLVDRLIWIHAASIIGNDGIAAVGELDLAQLAAAPCFTRTSVQQMGDDVVETLTLQPFP